MLSNFTDFLSESVEHSGVYLIDVFEDYPSDDELIWNFIGSYEFENELFEVNSIPIGVLVSSDFVSNYEINAEPWQKEYVSSLMRNTDGLEYKIVVVEASTKLVIDGYHKLMAMYMMGQKNVNVIEI